MRLKCYVFILFLHFFNLTTSYSQEHILQEYSPIDSLVKKDYKTLIKHFNRTAPDYQIEPDSLFAHEVAMTYLWKAYQMHDTLNMGKAYSMLGQLEGLRLDYLDKAISYTENYNDEFQPITAYRLKFINFYYDGNYKKSIDMLFKALEYSKRSENEYLTYYIEGDINVLNANWGDKQQAIKDFLKCHSSIRSGAYGSIFFNDSKQRKEQEYIDIQYYLAQTYYEVGELKKASVYIDSVYDFGLKNDLLDYKLQFYGLKGGILYRDGKYQEALKYTSQFLELEDPEDVYAISRSSVIKGLTLWKLNRKEEALQNIKKADSLYQITDDEFEELGEGYQLLVNHYKDIEDAESQLLYLNKLIEFDEKIASNYIEIGNRITQEYTLPQLLAEKDEVISQLTAQKNTEKRTKYIVVILLGISSVIILYYIRQQYVSKKEFSVLQQEFEQAKMSVVKPEIVLSMKPESLNLDEKQLAIISKGLKDFEQSQGFLEANSTLKSVAQGMQTNSSYLSKYINAVKETNFSQYISTLRIQYAIYRLQEDRTLRSYTIEAIANEVGFSNTRSFTNHFKRVTGITVSYFIKKLPAS